jgi:RNA polymerase sigma-70 factor (ECF subfamily)
MAVDLDGLYRRFAALVHGIALAHVGPDDADDVVQEVFVRLSGRLHQLREAAALPGWIAAAARNASLDRLRRRARAPRQAAPADLEQPAPPAPASEGLLRERALALIGTLPEVYREALVLRLVEGLDGPTIARLTGHTPGSVRVHLHRGLALLRPLLAKEGWA